MKEVIIFNEDGDFVERKTVEKEEEEIQEEPLVMDVMLEEKTSIVEEIEPEEIEPAAEKIAVGDVEPDIDFQCEKMKELPLQNRFQSSVANMIHRVIGMDTKLLELEEFDKHHIIFKNYKYESSRKICSKILPTLQKKVKEKLSYYENAVTSWEKEFFSKNEKLPSLTDIEKDAGHYHNYKQLLRCQKIVKFWNLKT